MISVVCCVLTLGLQVERNLRFKRDKILSVNVFFNFELVSIIRYFQVRIKLDNLET